MPALANNQIFFCFCKSLNVIIWNKVLCIIKDNPETMLCIFFLFLKLVTKMKMIPENATNKTIKTDKF